MVVLFASDCFVNGTKKKPRTSAVGCHEVGLYDIALDPRPLTALGGSDKKRLKLVTSL